MLISLADPNLTLNPSPDANLIQPGTTGLNIIDWMDTYAPKLNDHALSLTQNEVSRSLAIAPDHSKFLLGTIWYLRLFDATGQQLWQVTAPSTA